MRARLKLRIECGALASAVWCASGSSSLPDTPPRRLCLEDERKITHDLREGSWAGCILGLLYSILGIAVYWDPQSTGASLWNGGIKSPFQTWPVSGWNLLTAAQLAPEWGGNHFQIAVGFRAVILSPGCPAETWGGFHSSAGPPVLDQSYQNL